MESGLHNLRVARGFSWGKWKVIFNRVSTSPKSRAQFFRAKIANSSRQVQRGQGTGDREQGTGIGSSIGAQGDRGVHLDTLSFLKQDAVFTRAFLTTKVTKDTKTKHRNSCLLCGHCELVVNCLSFCGHESAHFWVIYD